MNAADFVCGAFVVARWLLAVLLFIWFLGG
jgi:hypothetical protein